MSTGSSSSAMRLLDRFYFSSTPGTYKDTKCERFTQSFLQTESLRSEQFEKVWMWEQRPDRRAPDTGIDLVTQRRDGGKTAIQCKYYDPGIQGGYRHVPLRCRTRRLHRPQPHQPGHGRGGQDSGRRGIGGANCGLEAIENGECEEVSGCWHGGRLRESPAD